MDYAGKSLLFKAFGDPTRLKIVDMISSGELCACVILEEFDITQPSLSHHMKILCDCGLVNGRKEGKWTYYSLNEKAVQDFKTLLTEITSCNRNCKHATDFKKSAEINCKGDCCNE
jgi:ArsR family transcriptional regulator